MKCHCQLCSMEHLERLATYVSWPENCKYSPIRLASAGFRYLGVADNILCDVCGLIIGDWRQHEELDDPVRQHARRSPRCQLSAAVDASTSRPFSPVAPVDRPSFRRQSPTTASPRPSTGSTKLVPPAVPSAHTGMASRDLETGALSVTDHVSPAASGTATAGGCCAAEAAGCSANVNKDSSSGSKKTGQLKVM